MSSRMGFIQSRQLSLIPFASTYDGRRQSDHLLLKFPLRDYVKHAGLARAITSNFYAVAERLFQLRPCASHSAIHCARFVAALGPDWAGRVASFPTCMHLRLLFLGSVSQRFRELVYRLPGLAVQALEVVTRRCGGKHLTGADVCLRDLLIGSWRCIAVRLGWGTGVISLLSHIWPPAASFENLSAIKSRLSSSAEFRKRALRVLPGCDYITSDILRICVNEAAFRRVNNAFLLSACARPPHAFLPGHGLDVVLANVLNAEKYGLRVPSILQSPEQLLRLSEEFPFLTNPKRLNHCLTCAIPRPPFSCDDGLICALSDPKAVLREYAELGPNCSPGLLPSICSGDHYIYQVLPDTQKQVQRAILVVLRQQRGNRSVWVVYDARTRRNGPISSATRNAITEFLCRMQGISEGELSLPTDDLHEF